MSLRSVVENTAEATLGPRRFGLRLGGRDVLTWLRPRSVRRSAPSLAKTTDPFARLTRHRFARHREACLQVAPYLFVVQARPFHLAKAPLGN